MKKLLLLVVLTFELYAPYPSYDKYGISPYEKNILRIMRLGATVPELIGATSLPVSELKRSCNLNDGVGCAKLGYLYHTGQIVKQDFTKAKEYYSKSCNMNVGVACNNLGELYEYGEGVTQDYSEARKYYGKACHDYYNIGCTNLGILYLEGKGVKEDSSEAKKYFKKGCNLNDSAGCTNLSVLYAKKPSDSSEMEKYYQYSL